MLLAADDIICCTPSATRCSDRDTQSILPDAYADRCTNADYLARGEAHDVLAHVFGGSFDERTVEYPVHTGISSHHGTITQPHSRPHDRRTSRTAGAIAEASRKQ